jgi:hypothetical protein
MPLVEFTTHLNRNDITHHRSPGQIGAFLHSGGLVSCQCYQLLYMQWSAHRFFVSGERNLYPHDYVEEDDNFFQEK